MIPKRPPRVGQVGFVYAHPYRVQGISIAGEQTVVQVPELDVAFDIGLCPRVALASRIIALSHGHMDHVAGLPYFFSHRHFLKMGPSVCLAPAELVPALERMMQAWIDVENQRTPHEFLPMRPGDTHEIKNNLFLRAVPISHTVPALGYVVIERRNKLREEFRELPQERLRELKSRGEEITQTLEIPIVAYTGDTELCPSLYADDFVRAQIVVTECTFFDDQHRGRSKVGKHLHVDDLSAMLNVWQAGTVVVVHVSRRTNLTAAKQRLIDAAGESARDRVHFLMDHRGNHQRYEELQARIEREGAL